MKSFPDETSAVAPRHCVRHGLRAGAALGLLWLSSCTPPPPPVAPDPVRVTWTKGSSSSKPVSPAIARRRLDAPRPVFGAPAPQAVVSRGPARSKRQVGRSERQLESVRWLSPEHVSRAVRARHAEFSACRTLSGTAAQARGEASVTLGWQVGADGAVSDVSLSRTSFESAEVNRCMLSVAREVRFPPSPNASEISWTVRFQADGRQLAVNPLGGAR